MTADQPPAKAILSEHLYKLAIEDVKVHNLDMRFRAIERLLAHDAALRARVAELEEQVDVLVRENVDLRKQPESIAPLLRAVDQAIALIDSERTWTDGAKAYEAAQVLRAARGGA